VQQVQQVQQVQWAAQGGVLLRGGEWAVQPRPRTHIRPSPGRRGHLPLREAACRNRHLGAPLRATACQNKRSRALQYYAQAACSGVHTAACLFF